ncbi:ABC transporter ATP-binding protein [Amycolatopsis pithecellobii]|uniref:ATP-binding cassette domain-containing protein n=1 Tax=Amycolatopsis pithecellobii TaxID=664692 RepID=A0A6N7YR46_9PSEU|nr:ATP-binding cassette domain-containing protein [Amycolatopsis pithecellobii]MTD54452.1 ATP-binding cassette domain-containing protein [Amycolatopsis pithecellobii]
MTAPVLEVAGLCAGYGSLTAVSGVSLCVAPGEVVALFGPNGAGKTSTLLATVGVLPRNAGRVHWNGVPAPKSLHTFTRAGLAFVPEQRSTISSLSVLDNLRLGRGTVELALEYFPELADHLHRPAGLLSGGQQQILMLARALAGRPRILLVDELSMGLAPLVVERLLGVVRRAAEEDGLGVLLVEQQMRRALSVADRWYLLSHGKVAAQGDAHESGGAVLEEAYLESMGITQSVA